MYNFLFDKRSLTLLLGGLALGGALLFAAGLLLGVQWGVPSGTQTAAARPCPEPIVLAAALPSPQPVKPEAATAPPPAAQPATQPAAPATTPDIEEVAPTTGGTTDAAEAAVPAPAAAPAPANLAMGGPADDEDDLAVAAFAVQVGAFANPANSRTMVETLERRGYDAYIVELPGRRRVLHTVRFGRFAEHAQAAQAAADFRRKEGMEAVVEETDTL